MPVVNIELNGFTCTKIAGWTNWRWWKRNGPWSLMSYRKFSERMPRKARCSAATREHQS